MIRTHTCITEVYIDITIQPNDDDDMTTDLGIILLLQFRKLLQEEIIELNSLATPINRAKLDFMTVSYAKISNTLRYCVRFTPFFVSLSSYSFESMQQTCNRGALSPQKTYSAITNKHRRIKTYLLLLPLDNKIIFF